ncbi:hypothetical protein [Fodinibius sp. SL11]|uniref:hypothetical protein n=1 Tax=Fodinibius sp. SL11 TaxID=3425690 RepID=UPI003F885B40
MDNKFESTIKLKGVLIVDEEELGICRYELTYNPFDTNSMKILLFEPPGKVPRGPDSPSVEIVTNFHGGLYKITLNPELAGEKNRMEYQYYAPVTEFQKTQIFNKKAVPETVSCGYLFPITSVTDSHVITSRHSTYGFVRGDYDHDEGVFQPQDDSFSISTPIGDIEIGDGFYFQENDDKLYPKMELIRRSRAGLELELGDRSLREGLDEVRGVTYNFFHFLSLVERTWIDWHTERFAVRSAEDEVISQSTRYRWVTQPHFKYRPNYNDLPESRETLEKVLTAYWNSGDDKQIEIDGIIDNFKIANIVRTLQTKFIHWHSCLDFFKPIYFEELPEKVKNRVNYNMSFSMQLIYLFDIADIEISDVLKDEPINKIRDSINGNGKAPDLKFTELRNKYLHDGFHVFNNQLQDVQRLTEKMRALAERLLTSYMEIDYSSTNLGESKLL